MSSRRNVMEGILAHFLEQSLALRFDVCRCELCKHKMMEYLLSKFPPVYVDVDEPQYKKIESEIMHKYVIQVFTETGRAINYAVNNPPHPMGGDKEEAFDQLLTRIKEIRGLDLTYYHRSVLQRRIALRLRANNIGSYYEYISFLAANPGEYQKLFDILTVNVSDFFRDYHVWVGIKKIIQNVVIEHVLNHRPLKIWSAGCAKGEEPYSLAVMLSELGVEYPYSIYATDIDRDSLEQAVSGVYEEERINKVFKQPDPHLIFDLNKYFDYDQDKYFCKENIRKMVRFQYLDLTSSEYIKDCDIILCRNVFIYFTKAVQERILDKFYHSLRDGGYLVLGITESLVPEAKLVFKEIDMYNKIYQKSSIDKSGG